MNCVTCGATIILPSASFDARAVLAAIEEERATVTGGVPTMFIAQFQHPDFSRFDLRSLRGAIMGGSPCPVELLKRVNSEMFCRDLCVVYGQTEASPVITMHAPDDTLEQRTTTVGGAAQNVEVKIIDPMSGKTVPRGELGELEIAYISALSDGLIPRLLRRFRTKFPRVHMRLRALRPWQQAEALLENDLNLGFIGLPMPELSPRLDFEVFRRDRMVAAVLNNFIGAMTVILVYRVTRSIFSEWTAVRAAWWCCFMPSLVIWSAQTVKEPTVILLETAALYACIHLQSRSFRVRHFWMLIFCLAFLVTFRFYAAYLAIVAVAVSLAMPNLRKINFSTVSSALVAIVLVVLLYSSGTLIQNETLLEKFDLKSAQKFRADVAQGAGSGVSMDVNLETPAGFVYGVGLGAAYLLLAPFPWQWGGGSLRLLLTLPELLVWWYLFFQFVIPGLKKAVKERFFDILAVPDRAALSGLGRSRKRPK